MYNCVVDLVTVVLCQGKLAYELIVVRIDNKMPRPGRLPFLDSCVQNGSPRDALQQVVYVRISLRGHRRHIRFFILDGRFHSHWNMAIATALWTTELGSQEDTTLGRTSTLVDSLGCK